MGQLESIDLDALIDKAVRMGADVEVINELDEFATMRELMNEAPKESLAHYLWWMAVDVIQAEFPEAEQYIKADPFYWNSYKEYVAYC